MQYRIEGPVFDSVGRAVAGDSEEFRWAGTLQPRKHEWKVLTSSGDTVCVCFDPRDAERVCSALSMAS